MLLRQLWFPDMEVSMKEFYTAPCAELISFVAMEKLATGEHTGIPFNDEQPQQPGSGGQSVVPAPW